MLLPNPELTYPHMHLELFASPLEPLIIYVFIIIPAQLLLFLPFMVISLSYKLNTSFSQFSSCFFLALNTLLSPPLGNFPTFSVAKVFGNKPGGVG